MLLSFPDFAHLVTVFESTLKRVATSAGVRSGSDSAMSLDPAVILDADILATLPIVAGLLTSGNVLLSWLTGRSAAPVTHTPARPVSGTGGGFLLFKAR